MAIKCVRILPRTLEPNKLCVCRKITCSCFRKTWPNASQRNGHTSTSWFWDWGDLSAVQTSCGDLSGVQTVWDDLSGIQTIWGDLSGIHTVWNDFSGVQTKCKSLCGDLSCIQTTCGHLSGVQAVYGGLSGVQPGSLSCLIMALTPNRPQTQTSWKVWVFLDCQDPS